MWNDNIDKKQTGERRGFGNPNISAALQLYITTREEKYKKVFEDSFWELLNAPSSDTNRSGNNPISVGLSYIFAVYPYMDADFRAKLRPFVQKYKELTDAIVAKNPYGVPMDGRGWAGNTPIMTWAINNYFVHKYYPDIMDAEYVYKGMNYIFGCHPYSNISFVAAIGARSKKMTYGNNRADFTFIAGGVVPGLLFLQPDFYENKDDWPFLWGENEAIITTATPYIFLSHAIAELSGEINK